MCCSSFFILFIVCLSVEYTNGIYTKVQYRDCGSSDVSIHSIAIEPMPIKYPGSMNIKIMSSLKRLIDSSQISVNIIRTVSGIRLPFKCYNYDGVNVGSCNYTSEQLCNLMNNWWPKTFGLYLTSMVSNILGHTCSNSSYSISTQKINTYQENLQMPDLSNTILSYVMTGDFNTTVKAFDRHGEIFCGTFEYTIQKG